MDFCGVQHCLCYIFFDRFHPYKRHAKTIYVRCEIHFDKNENDRKVVARLEYLKLEFSFWAFEIELWQTEMVRHVPIDFEKDIFNNRKIWRTLLEWKWWIKIWNAWKFEVFASKNNAYKISDRWIWGFYWTFSRTSIHKKESTNIFGRSRILSSQHHLYASGLLFAEFEKWIFLISLSRFIQSRKLNKYKYFIWYYIWLEFI